ncbi:hypothetical protein [Gorillibacterium sp. CAU 1737]|uniref:hypothetical protein n=1 Tax=Gorillibacterium sp. CAU 1737 TaxID=3140362 RepID=UPI003260F8FA
MSLLRANASREMTPQEERYFLHLLSGDPMFKDFVRSQAMHGENAAQRIMKQPVCPKCERGAFYHKDGVACSHCGYMGASAHKIRQHIRGGHYR